MPTLAPAPQACFLLQPDKRPAAGTLEAFGAFPPLFFGHEPPALAQLRRRRYEADWAYVRAEIAVHTAQLGAAILDQIVRFVDAEGEYAHLAPREAAAGGAGWPFRELPTGIICAGVNVPDHDTFFARLTDRLRRSAQQHHVAVLTAATCGASLKAIVQSLTRQLVTDDDVVAFAAAAATESSGADTNPIAKVQRYCRTWLRWTLADIWLRIAGELYPQTPAGRRLPPYDFRFLRQWHATLEPTRRRGTRAPSPRPVSASYLTRKLGARAQHRHAGRCRPDRDPAGGLSWL